MALNLRNPHSVLAVLEARPKDVLEVVIPHKMGLPPQGLASEFSRESARESGKEFGDLWRQIAVRAQSLGIRISTSPPTSGQRPGQRMGKRSGKGAGNGARDGRKEAGRPGTANEESQRTGVAEAVVRERPSVSLEELFRNGRSRKEGKGLWIALDTLQDPHNVGAVFRAAAYFAVEGIILTQDRSAPMTATVYDVASGGVEYVPFVQQTNLQRAFEIARDSGLWILGSSEHAKDRLDSVDRDRPWLLVLGNEEKGMRRLTEESCDKVFRIAGSGKVTSLNVSVAAGIMISSLST